MSALKVNVAVPLPERKEDMSFNEQLQVKVDREILDLYLKLKDASGRRGAADWHRKVLKANLKALEESGKI